MQHVGYEARKNSIACFWEILEYVDIGEKCYYLRIAYS